MGKTAHNAGPTSCTLDGCNRPYLAKGYCQLHYARVRRLGVPGKVDALRTQDPHNLDNKILLKRGVKRCRDCNRTKDLHLFYKQGPRYSLRCRSCHKKHTKGSHRAPLLKGYQLMVSEYDILMEHSDGKCWICGGGSTKSLAVDHNHTNGNVRGLLCTPCNRVLGRWKDDADKAMKAYQYLRDDGGHVSLLLNRQPKGRTN